MLLIATAGGSPKDTERTIRTVVITELNSPMTTLEKFYLMVALGVVILLLWGHLSGG